MSCLCGEHSTVTEHLEEEFEDIADLIVVNKIRYYTPEKADKIGPIDDEIYDTFEMRYLQLCFLLNRPNQLVHKEYQKLSYPNEPEKGDWVIPEHLNGKGMMEVDWENERVKKVLKRWTK